MPPPEVPFSVLLHSHSPLPPGFELSHCDNPGVPQFGFKVSDEGHFAGSAIAFGCDQGYTLHGSGTLKCMTGERRAWNSSLPSCIGEILSGSCFVGSIWLMQCRKRPSRSFTAEPAALNHMLKLISLVSSLATTWAQMQLWHVLCCLPKLSPVKSCRNLTWAVFTSTSKTLTVCVKVHEELCKKKKMSPKSLHLPRESSSTSSRSWERFKVSAAF